VRLFKKLGFIHAARGSLRLIDEKRLLEDWRAATAATAPDEYRLQWLLPRSDGHAQLADALSRLRTSTEAGAKACIALYAAADRLGYRHVQGVPPHVYVQRPSTLIPESIGTAEVGPDERADLHIRRPASLEAIFRGAVDASGVPCTDIIQTWIDTSGHSVRGEEQADYIWRRVLAPMIEKRSRDER